MGLNYLVGNKSIHNLKKASLSRIQMNNIFYCENKIWTFSDLFFVFFFKLIVKLNCLGEQPFRERIQRISVGQ